jgi:predicted RNase H-like nuclease
MPTTPPAPLVAGVDGCRGGWLVVRGAAPPGSTPHPPEVVPTFAEVLARLRSRQLEVVAVDMPIGLSARGPRACDDEARRRLGPRRATVFATPPRPLLDAPTHAEAVRRGRALDGRGISVQAFNLLGRMAEIDTAVVPGDCARLVEAHPESGFAAMAGAPLRTSKRTEPGRRERLELLTREVGPVHALRGRPPEGAAVDDVLDAAANLWTARRWVAGVAEVLGDGSHDERGLPLRIVV